MDTTPRTDGPGPASLAWQAEGPGMMAAGVQYEYLIATAADGITRLTRWVSRDAGVTPKLMFGSEIIANAIVVADPDMGKLAAQAYEDGRSVHGLPAWQHIGSRKPDFYGRQAPAPGPAQPS